MDCMLMTKMILPRLFVFLLAIGLNFGSAGFIQGPEAAVSLITPYVNESDMASINEAFSVDECAPWGFGDHLGIDFFPKGVVGNFTDKKSFQAVCSGTVTYVDQYYNPGGGPNGNGQYQVNLSIDCDANYSIVYAFETWSEDVMIGDNQLYNIQIEHGIQVNTTVTQGDVIGDLFKAGDGAHVHFGLKENGIDMCPDPYFTPVARDSVLNVLHLFYPHARICYGLDEMIPSAAITVDGYVTDWASAQISPIAGDFQNDGQYLQGDDIQAIYIAKDLDYLYLRMDLWENVNPEFGNGPAPDQGRYAFQIESDGPFPDLYLGVAGGDSPGGWSLGFNGSNGEITPPALEDRPDLVGVSGNVIEIKVPFSVIGISANIHRVRGEVTDCCVPGWDIMDETHCVSHLHLAPAVMSIQKILVFIGELQLHRGIAQSLESKLESAIHSIERGGAKTAQNKLKAFINQVEAQEGKKIPTDEALTMIEAARNVIDILYN